MVKGASAMPRKPEIGTEEHLQEFLRQQHIRPESKLGLSIQEMYRRRMKLPDPKKPDQPQA